MPLVKITRNGQVTLPVAIRKALQVDEGDHLEATLGDGVVTFRPVSVTSSDQADRELDAILARVKWAGPEPRPSEDELMEAIVEDIHATRRDLARDHAKGSA